LQVIHNPAISRAPRPLRWSCALYHSESSTNVYEQLGFPDAEAMLVKAQLVSQIAEILRERGWSQQQAEKILGLDAAQALQNAARPVSRHQRDEEDGLPVASGPSRQNRGCPESQASRGTH